MDDLISRQAEIDHFRLIIDATNTDSRYNMGFVDGLEFCISHLSTIPSAQTEKWFLEICPMQNLKNGYMNMEYVIQIFTSPYHAM